MGFAGANAALGAPCVSAACPYELFDQLPAAALEAAPPPLRVLLVSGVADVDVPAWMSLKLAAKAWAAPRSTSCSCRGPTTTSSRALPTRWPTLRRPSSGLRSALHCAPSWTRTTAASRHCAAAGCRWPLGRATARQPGPAGLLRWAHRVLGCATLRVREESPSRSDRHVELQPHRQRVPKA